MAKNTGRGSRSAANSKKSKLFLAAKKYGGCFGDRRCLRKARRRERRLELRRKWLGWVFPSDW